MASRTNFSFAADMGRFEVGSYKSYLVNKLLHVGWVTEVFQRIILSLYLAAVFRWLEKLVN